MDNFTPHIVGLGGSLRTGSASLSALRAALAAATDAGAEVELLDVRELELPPYGGDAPVVPAGAARLREAVGAADGMIWSSPLYHGTVSGTFKNALDWLQLLADDDPPFLTGKPVGLVAAAGGSHGLQAINTMEFVVRALRGWTVPFVVPVAQAYQAFDREGSPRDPSLSAQLALLGGEVVTACRLLSASRA